MFNKEAAEGEEAPEPTEEESEQGPEPLSTLDKDAEVEGGEAWTPLFSSTNSGVKNQVRFLACFWSTALLTIALAPSATVKQQCVSAVHAAACCL